jgi:hypothetical protein
MTSRSNRRAGAVVAAAVVVATVAVSISVLRSPSRSVTSTCTVSTGSHTPPYTLTPYQAQNAAIIAAVGIRKGLPDHAVTVALAAALQESRLEDLTYGDRDSLGLFQQRPSEGWGTSAQILNPAFAAGAFFDHLATVSGWESMPVTQAAQLVQRSAVPDAYAQWESEARALAVATTGERAAGLTCQLSSFVGSQPASGALASAATAQLGPHAFGTPATSKKGWQIAAWAVAHAYAYHLTSVSYDGRRWTWDSGAPTWAASPVTTRVVTSGP